MGLFGTKRASAADLGELLTTAVLQGFASHIGGDEDREWLRENRAFGAGILRFLAASAWVSADIHLQSEKVTKPDPEAMMQAWRQGVFSSATAWLSLRNEADKAQLWADLFDDVDVYLRILTAKVEAKVPLLTASVARAWFDERQAFELLDGYNGNSKAGLMVIAAATDLNDTVRALLAKHCR